MTPLLSNSAPYSLSRSTTQLSTPPCLAPQLSTPPLDNPVPPHSNQRGGGKQSSLLPSCLKTQLYTPHPNSLAPYLPAAQNPQLCTLSLNNPALYPHNNAALCYLPTLPAQQ